jgi:site-specific recombinase XerD
MQRAQEAIEAISEQMRERGYKDRTVATYQRHWKQLINYAADRSIQNYTARVGVDFLADVHEITAFSKSDKLGRTIVRAIMYLNDFLDVGVLFPYSPPNSAATLLNHFDNMLLKFKSHQVQRHEVSNSTLKSYDKGVGKFLLFLEKQGILRASDISAQHILKFAEVLAHQSDSVAYNMSCTLRVFLRYLYKEGLADTDLSRHVPVFGHVRKSKLPSVLADDEVGRLIGSIDRSSPTGKRNYAIILTACRLGLRSGDICALKFSDINWVANKITIETQKTRDMLTLPLMEDVGCAIIDYVKHGRPATDSPVVFQTHIAPTKPLTNTAITAIVKKHAAKASIDMAPERHIGPHVMRHTLASALLKENVPLHEISGILGHSSMKTTQMYYLRIDVRQLRECALEVPPFAWESDEEVL